MVWRISVMDFKYLLTSFEGRISRKQLWIGVICLIVLSFVLIFALGVLLGWLLPASLVPVLGMLIVMYPAAAIYTKRLHDRNKPMSPWLWIFLLPSVVYVLLSSIGIGFAEVEIPGQPPVMMPSGIIGFVISMSVAIVGLWALVELGFLKGTSGENDYGPDPVN